MSKIKALELEIKRLKTRIRDLESRPQVIYVSPTYVSPTYVSPMSVPAYPTPSYPLGPIWCGDTTGDQLPSLGRAIC